MKFVTAFAAATMLLAPLSATMAASQDALQPLLDEAVELLSDRDLVPAGWTQRGTLPKGGEATYKVSLKGSTSFEVIGRCDAECGDLNLYITDSKGKPVASDDAEDDFPIVEVDKPGSYTVRVEMKDCAVANCAYGVMSFRSR